ncbi:MAG: hypothetical protein ACOZBZ_02430 [Patescibacteria group bacterium]
MRGPKATFSTIFLILVITLMILPFLTTFNEFLTALIYKIGWYRVIQDFLLPFETRMIVVVVEILGQKAVAGISTVSVLRDDVWQKIAISWNCIGWQSALVLFVTLLTGLQGPYTKVSKLECLAIGILGTFLINILRISLVAILIVYINAIPATVAHDYFSAFILILWLFFYWWFSYSFVLEEKIIREDG